MGGARTVTSNGSTFSSPVRANGSSSSGGNRKKEVVLVDTPPTVRKISPVVVNSSPKVGSSVAMVGAVDDASAKGTTATAVSDLKGGQGAAALENDQSIGKSECGGSNGEICAVSEKDGMLSGGAVGGEKNSTAENKNLGAAAAAVGKEEKEEGGQGKEQTEQKDRGSICARSENSQEISGGGGSAGGPPWAAVNSGAKSKGPRSRDRSGGSEGAGAEITGAVKHDGGAAGRVEEFGEDEAGSRNDDKIMEVCGVVPREADTELLRRNVLGFFVFVLMRDLRAFMKGFFVCCRQKNLILN